MTAFWRSDINPDHRPHKVLIERDTLIDTARENRPVKIKVYYPVDHSIKTLPVIFWSHGFGGSVDGAAFLSRFLASHGYILIHVQHLGTDSSLWQGNAEEHPWDILRRTTVTRATTLNRFFDIPFVLDHFEGWSQSYPNIASYMDLNTLGISGHSFGALTTQVLAGMMFPDEKGKLRQWDDKRFQAAIAYSPNPIAHLSVDDPQDIYSSIHLPMFHMSGTDDGSPIENWEYTQRLVVYEHSVKADKHLLVLNEGDHMVFNGSRGKLGENKNRHRHEEIIKMAALAYWDGALKNDQQAKEWLTGTGLKAYAKEDATYEFSGIRS